MMISHMCTNFFILKTFLLETDSTYQYSNSPSFAVHLLQELEFNLCIAGQEALACGANVEGPAAIVPGIFSPPMAFAVNNNQLEIVQV